MIIFTKLMGNLYRNWDSSQVISWSRKVRIIVLKIKVEKKREVIKTLFVSDYLDEPNYYDMLESIVCEFFYDKKHHRLQSIEILIKEFDEKCSRNVFNTVDSEMIINGKNLSESLENTFKDIFESYDRHITYREKYEGNTFSYLVRNWSRNKKLLFILAIYIKYVANIALSYGKYVGNQKMYDGFNNDEYNYKCPEDDSIYIKRRNFNSFVSFMLNEKIVAKEYLPGLIEANKKYLKEAHKFGESTLLLRVNRQFVDYILSPYNEYPKNEFVEYVVKEMKIYKQSKNAK